MLNLIEQYISLFRFNMQKAYMNKRLKSIQNDFSGTILDIGAGNQPYRSFFKCDTYIATNTRRHYSNDSEIEKYTDVWIEDASSLPFEDNTMEGILCFQVLSVVKDPQKFFDEATRILKPKGKLILTTDWLYPSWSNEDKARYSNIELKAMAEKAGLIIHKIEGFGGLRSLQYMLHIRWVAAYPERIKSASGLKKILRIFQWIYYLKTLPFYSIKGWWAFQLEKNTADNLSETFNLLLLAEKPR